MAGIVYLLTNPAMPGLVKIGRTTRNDLEERMRQLYSTGVPTPFICVKAVTVEDESAIERALHTAFGPNRINKKREFFEIEPVQAVALLKQLGTEDVTPEVQQENKKNIDNDYEDAGAELNRREKSRSMGPKMNFHQMGLVNGSILESLSSDDTATVCGPKKVQFRGDEMSLTRATRIVLDTGYNPQPSPYWLFDGELLKDIYERTYRDSDDDSDE